MGIAKILFLSDTHLGIDMPDRGPRLNESASHIEGDGLDMVQRLRGHGLDTLPGRNRLAAGGSRMNFSRPTVTPIIESLLINRFH